MDISASDYDLAVLALKSELEKLGFESGRFTVPVDMFILQQFVTDLKNKYNLPACMPCGKKKGASTGCKAAKTAVGSKAARTTDWREQQGTRTIQPEWFVLYAWLAEADGSLFCKICEAVTGRKKLLECKRDALDKHEGPHHQSRVKEYEKRKAKEALDSNQATMHSALPAMKAEFEGYKTQQLIMCFFVLKKMRSMVQYEDMFELFDKLGVDSSVNHRTDVAGWEMGEAIAEVVADDLRQRISRSPFISISVDESSSCDNLFI